MAPFANKNGRGAWGPRRRRLDQLVPPAAWPRRCIDGGGLVVRGDRNSTARCLCHDLVASITYWLRESVPR